MNFRIDHDGSDAVVYVGLKTTHYEVNCDHTFIKLTEGCTIKNVREVSRFNHRWVLLPLAGRPFTVHPTAAIVLTVFTDGGALFVEEFDA